MDAVGEIKARLNIEDVIGEYVQLKRTGRNFKGIKPLDQRKTASFIVSPEKQIWHDFSSGKGGDMFSFRHGDGRPGFQGHAGNAGPQSRR
jgi:DNA primase